jgi:hypothetical protein
MISPMSVTSSSLGRKVQDLDLHAGSPADRVADGGKPFRLVPDCRIRSVMPEVVAEPPRQERSVGCSVVTPAMPPITRQAQRRKSTTVK